MDLTDPVIDVPFTWNAQYRALKKLITKKALVNVATLGPSGTSSEAAAKHFLSELNCKNGQYKLYPTYEEAFEGLISGKSDFLIVANAYERIDRIYMSQESHLLFPFVYETPLYGIAKRSGENLPENQPLKIATHHAPVSLIPWFLTDFNYKYDVLFVKSTSEAAMKLRDGEVDLCVTTENAVKKYGVKFITKTRPILMLWSVFIRQEDLNSINY
ncbi:bacilysin biosynthesis protein BacA [Scopulibacillus daqui]|uniref:Bacilysin biosynthesis protein BacA n=1 Tax=Scopulibacillus daqui TaxID=1469162 RepID=A0ABS2PWZ1_9BACL|nr:bacilysin biosynthesis protein BacA [Scopulibacillus daqui]MBM7644579.1 bacilysin biosynthesis protein BacA [Scopulibacillus daqui]